jgi:hypothetical protein
MMTGDDDTEAAMKVEQVIAKMEKVKQQVEKLMEERRRAESAKDFAAYNEIQKRIVSAMSRFEQLDKQYRQTLQSGD